MSKKLLGVDGGDYIFSPSTKTITILNASITLENLLLVVNTTSGTMLYNFADPTLNASIANNTITLTYDTTSMNSSDMLQVFYEDGIQLATDKSLDAIYQLLGMLLDRVEFGNLTDNAKRLKVNLIDSGTLANVGTLSNITAGNLTSLGTLSNQSRIGDIQAQRVYEAQADTAFNVGIMNHVTF
jgi:hypothetical protein